MHDIKALHSFTQIKILADVHRMKILRLLMDTPATLTQLAQALKHSPAWVRHHMLALQAAGLIEMVEVRKTGKARPDFFGQ